jgi:beta-N-acetylhexosaminidase
LQNDTTNMIKKIIGFSIGLMINFHAGFAQYPKYGENTLDLIIQAERGICVLKNHNSLIPVKDLEKRKIACLSISENDLNVFHDRLSDYAEVKHFGLKPTTSDGELMKILQELKEFNYIIYAIQCHDDNERMSYGATRQMGELLYKLSKVENLVFVVFGNGKVLNELQGSDLAHAIMVSPSALLHYQDIAAQIIFGGIGARGLLSESVNPQFQKGFGLLTKGGIRFKYTVPEEFKIDGELLSKQIDSIAESGIRKLAFPGCQVLAAKDGKVFYHKTYGFHTYDSLETVEKGNLYDMASVTKITGPLPALIKLYGEGKISLDSRFSEIYSDFRKTDKDSITLRELLAHHSGFVPFIPFWKQTIKKNGKFKRNTLRSKTSKRYPIEIYDNLFLHKNYHRKVYKAITKSKLKEKHKYVYSDLPFITFPKYIELVTNEKYDQYLSSNFYKPLGAHTFMYNPMQKYPKKAVIPTEIDSFFRKGLVHGYVHDESAAIIGGISGNAGLFGSAGDLAKIMQMYMNMGNYGDRQFLTDPAMKEFTSYQFMELNSRRGLGFDKPLHTGRSKGYIAASASKGSFGHTGFTGTFCWVDPENGILFILLSNRVYPSRQHQQIFDLNIRQSMHQLIYDAFGIKRIE